jgi:hypothetical protein
VKIEEEGSPENVDNNENILKMEKGSISETLTTFYRTKQDRVPEGANPHDMCFITKIS